MLEQHLLQLWQCINIFLQDGYETAYMTFNLGLPNDYELQVEGIEETGFKQLFLNN